MVSNGQDVPRSDHEMLVARRAAILLAKARVLRWSTEDVATAASDLRSLPQNRPVDQEWLRLLDQPICVMVDVLLADTEAGAELRDAMPRALLIPLPEHRSEDRLRQMAQWQLENDRPYWAGDGQTFDQAERKREKALARERDEHDLATGRVTAGELHQRNSIFAEFDLAQANIILPDGGRWPEA